MWYDGYSAEEPAKIDFSSRKWVRVRKNIEYVEGDGEFIEPHWHYLERKIAKEDWDLFQEVQGHETTLDDVQNALIELAEMLVGGN
ncbi:MAG: hypothetical protein IK142_02535 [Clostridiales bacterium]|jgi:hypothetical protein|nr:hypothetical protein [Clostridiales bacterium]